MGTRKKKEKEIKLRESNRITYESLNSISGLIFEGVYRQADRTLMKIIRDNRAYKEEEESEKDRQSLNVVSFLGGRGRGKTSAMLSFLSYLNELQKENEWSEISKNRDIHFVILPYIDAAMLAEAEYIIDVILAEMWDKFERHTKRSCKSHNTEFERLERDIKQQFINVRQAYLLLKEREGGQTGYHEKEVPVPSALHDLAASVNLRDELQKLINNYLKIFQYGGADVKEEYYLVIAIDDVDMSGQKAHFILEQIRRFLRVQKVVFLITADIDRLQLACEARYQQIYTEGENRRKFINEYLEKVLPYNMRIYLPEIRERHGDIPVNTPAREKLGLVSVNEKDMILEFMAKKCGIYFDGNRRKRHFLQNQSMRSMVNYFEQMVRMEDESLAWLKIDLKERIIERIQKTEQKHFMLKLLSKDYEEINHYLITYLDANQYGFMQEKTIGQEKSMGRVLCACRSYEEEDAQNAEFVDAVIMLYSIILEQADEDTKRKVIGESLLGEQEYGLISSGGEDAPFCQSFDLLGSLELEVVDFSEAELRDNNIREILEKIIRNNKTEILAWLSSLLYVTLETEDEIEFTFEEIYLEPDPELEEYEDEAQSDQARRSWEIDLKPMVNARKNYLTNAFKEESAIRKQCDALLSGMLSSLMRWLEGKGKEFKSQEEKNGLCKSLLDEILAETDIILKGAQETESDETIQDNRAISVELLYSIGKMLSNQVRTYEFDEKEAYRMLQSSYQMVRKELRKRDVYFNKIGIKTSFEDRFESSLPARMLLEPDSLGKAERERFEMRLGNLLMEYRGKTTVLQKSIPSGSVQFPRITMP